MEKVPCPCCGVSGHAVCSQDGQYWKYVCENPNCKLVYVVDTKTGKPV